MKRISLTKIQISFIKEWDSGERIYYSECQENNMVCIGNAYRGFFVPKSFCAINKEICRDYSVIAKSIIALNNQDELIRLIDEKMYSKREDGKVKILEFRENDKSEKVVLNSKLLNDFPMDDVDYYINPKNKNIVIIKGFAEKGYVTLGFVMKMKG